ncbi:MAG: hypothetical protein FJ096_08155 [Deltaproteobacteria bacterium]|nr:hypothetical protein [Deltaproteobacteria bacterium]
MPLALEALLEVAPPLPFGCPPAPPLLLDAEVVAEREVKVGLPVANLFHRELHPLAVKHLVLRALRVRVALDAEVKRLPLRALRPEAVKRIRFVALARGLVVDSLEVFRVLGEAGDFDDERLTIDGCHFVGRDAADERLVVFGEGGAVLDHNGVPLGIGEHADRDRGVARAPQDGVVEREVQEDDVLAATAGCRAARPARPAAR